jgi:hypothetical protein
MVREVEPDLVEGLVDQSDDEAEHGVGGNERPPGGRMVIVEPARDGGRVVVHAVTVHEVRHQRVLVERCRRGVADDGTPSLRALDAGEHSVVPPAAAVGRKPFVRNVRPGEQRPQLEREGGQLGPPEDRARHYPASIRATSASCQRSGRNDTIRCTVELWPMR